MEEKEGEEKEKEVGDEGGAYIMILHQIGTPQLALF